MVFKDLLDNRRLNEAKTWLNRMIANNNTLHLFDHEVTFNTGKYYFENGDCKYAFQKWQEVVKDTGFRYFESEKKEYLDYSSNPRQILEIMSILPSEIQENVRLLVQQGDLIKSEPLPDD